MTETNRQQCECACKCATYAKARVIDTKTNQEATNEGRVRVKYLVEAEDAQEAMALLKSDDLIVDGINRCRKLGIFNVGIDKTGVIQMCDENGKTDDSTQYGYTAPNGKLYYTITHTYLGHV